MITPTIEGGARIPRCILQLSRGDVDAVASYVEAAKRDFRDVIYWAEYPEESRIDTPEKIEDFQETCEWLGLGRDHELDELKGQLEQQQLKQQLLENTEESIDRDSTVFGWIVALIIISGVLYAAYLLDSDSAPNDPANGQKPETTDREIFTDSDIEQSDAFRRLYGSTQQDDNRKEVR